MATEVLLRTRRAEPAGATRDVRVRGSTPATRRSALVQLQPQQQQQQRHLHQQQRQQSPCSSSTAAAAASSPFTYSCPASRVKPGRPGSPVATAAAAAATAGLAHRGVRRHQHTHNLKHRYEFLETLGKGTYGKVKKAIHRASGRKVAIKSIRKDKIKDDGEMVNIWREIENMSLLSHSNIIGVYEVFENKDKIVMVMECAEGGELYDFLSARRRLPDAEARRLFRQVVSAVHCCHKNGVVHRDLKLENILLDENNNIKLADFGLSSKFQGDRLLQTFCGSPLYASPEIVNGRPYRGPEVDSWALGVLLYTLVYGTMPFDGRDHCTLVRQISSGDYKEPTQPSDACGLIRWMLMVNPERRASIEDIASHWWVNWGHSGSLCDCDARAPPTGSPARSRGWSYPQPALDSHQRWKAAVAPAAAVAATVAGGGQRDGEEDGAGVAARPAGSAPAARCLQKSRKENDVTHTQAGAGAGGDTQPIAARAPARKPKSILKKRSDFAERSQPAARSLDSYTSSAAAGARCSFPDDAELPKRAPAPSPSQCRPAAPAGGTAKMPRKGILKNGGGGGAGGGGQRESGYYSSPERSGSLDMTVLLAVRTGGVEPDGSGGWRSILTTPPPPPRRGSSGFVVLRHKGILKRHGKFSPRPAGLGAEAPPPARMSRSLGDLLLLGDAGGGGGGGGERGSSAGGGLQSRPSSVMSDDSILSSESFDCLDFQEDVVDGRNITAATATAVTIGLRPSKSREPSEDSVFDGDDDDDDDDDDDGDDASAMNTYERVLQLSPRLI